MQYFCSNVLLFKKKKKMCKEYPYTIKKIFLGSSNDQTNFCLHFVSLYHRSIFYAFGWTFAL